MSNAAFRATALLTTGQTIVSEVSLEDVRAIRDQRAGHWTIPPGLDEKEELGRVVYTVLAERLSKGTGVLNLIDTDGRHWLIAAGSIAAIAFEDDLKDPQPVPEKRMGFAIESRDQTS